MRVPALRQREPYSSPECSTKILSLVYVERMKRGEQIVSISSPEERLRSTQSLTNNDLAPYRWTKRPHDTNARRILEVSPARNIRRSTACNYRQQTESQKPHANPGKSLPAIFLSYFLSTALHLCRSVT